jgi:hypothetical protein
MPFTGKIIPLIPIICITAFLPAEFCRQLQPTPPEEFLFSASATKRASARNLFFSEIITPSMPGFLLEHAIFSAVYYKIIEQMQAPTYDYAPVYIAEICTDLLKVLAATEYKKNYKLGAAAVTIAMGILNTASPEQLAGAEPARELAQTGIDTLYFNASKTLSEFDKPRIQIADGHSIGISDLWKLKRHNENLQQAPLNNGGFIEELTLLSLETMQTCFALRKALHKQ